jgi:uncharacterized membrane protein YbhN (UPF0104 family)
MSQWAGERSADPRRRAPGSPGPPSLETPPEARPPGLDLSRRNMLGMAGFLLASLAALYFLLPQLAGLDDTWNRLEDGDPPWLALGALLTLGMFGGYVAMFRGVFARAGTRRIDWRASYRITMAALAATRLFAAGGAGGLVLTAWALRRAGMDGRTVADKTISFLVLTYLPYVVAVIVCGFGLHWGLFPGEDPIAFTFVPAVIATIALTIGLSIMFVPTDLQRRLEDFADRRGRLGRVAQRLAHVPAASSAGLRDAFEHVRDRDPALLGAVAFWGFQIAVLWAALHAFGESPPVAVITQAFFVGMLGNLLPMPGGVGGVEGGMIAALVAFGVDGGLAVVAVLVFRAFTFWLPLPPGIVAYFQLRRTVEGWDRERRAALHYTN